LVATIDPSHAGAPTSSPTRVLVAAVALLGASACHRAPAEPPNPVENRLPSASAGTTGRVPEPGGTFRYDGAPRIVAIGDIHGDLQAARRALGLAGATNRDDDWIGGNLVVVQTGDEIDRGDDDRAVLDLFDHLAEKARAAGGRVLALNGNHEVMNVAGDFRYVTPGGFAAFASEEKRATPGTALDAFPTEARGRAAAFSPGGPYARLLAKRDAVAVVGDTVFAHGGVTAEHVRYGLGRLNAEVRAWMKNGGAPPGLAEDPEGPLWTRRYSDEKSGIDCDGLALALSALGVKRMVVGHTPHAEGISAACGERVWRIDSGLSKFYGGPTEVLEIHGDRVSVLKLQKKDAK